MPTRRWVSLAVPAIIAAIFVIGGAISAGAAAGRPAGEQAYTKFVTPNSKGHLVAAGSNQCLGCHTELSDWTNTPHTQKALLGKEYVIGWNADPAKYTGAAKWIVENRETYVHPKNKDASGNVIDQARLGIRAVISENPITYSDRTYGVDDIAYVIGSNYKQAYTVWVPGHGYKMLNIRYNNIGSANASMGERTDHRVWEGSCIGCHVTGFDPAALPANYKDSQTPFDLSPYMGDVRVGCEACHGPSGGRAHIQANPDSCAECHGGYATGMYTTGGKTINPAKLTQDQQIDVCGRCHGNWQWSTGKSAPTSRKDIPVFVPGDSLVELLKPENNNGVDRLLRPTWGATGSPKPFLGNGASNDDHQQWYDFKISAHYTKTDTVTCTTCHDPHNNNAGAKYGMRILKDTNTAAICATCHVGTNYVTKKGQPGAINPHTAKPYGVGVPETEWRADGKWPWEK